MKSLCRRKCSGQFDKGMVWRAASAGRFFCVWKYGGIYVIIVFEILCISKITEKYQEVFSEQETF